MRDGGKTAGKGRPKGKDHGPTPNGKQRSLCAARAREIFDDRARERQREGQKRGGATAGRGRGKDSSSDHSHTSNGKQSRDEAKVWIIQNQFGRRNLADIDRIALQQKLEVILRPKAEKNLSIGGKRGAEKTNRGSANLPKADQINTRRESAKAAGVGERTYDAGLMVPSPASPLVTITTRCPSWSTWLPGLHRPHYRPSDASVRRLSCETSQAVGTHEAGSWWAVR